MSNQLPPKLATGTIGELLVQIHLLQFGVQAAPPIKDTGNDLIAVRRDVFKSIQVKTTAGERYPVGKLPEFYNLLAVVHLVRENSKVFIGESKVYLIPKESIDDGTAPRKISELGNFRMTQARIDELFPA
jgi:hypothetical protein